MQNAGARECPETIWFLPTTPLPSFCHSTDDSLGDSVLYYGAAILIYYHEFWQSMLDKQGAVDTIGGLRAAVTARLKSINLL